MAVSSSEELSTRDTWMNNLLAAGLAYTPEQNRIVLQGVKAKKDGLHYCQNPYPYHSPSGRLWREGFLGFKV